MSTAPDALLFCENETNLARLYRPAQRRGYLQGRHRRLRWSQGDAERGQPGAGRHQVRGRITARNRRPAQRPYGAPAPSPDGARRSAPSAGFRRGLRSGARPRPTSSTPRCRRTSPTPTRGSCSARRSPACSGRSSSTITTSGDGSHGDPAQPPPPESRKQRPQRRLAPSAQRRHHLDAGQVGISLVRRPGISPSSALPVGADRSRLRQEQLLLLTRDWYMHPNGQLPAYEWAFGDANPPVHAWAAWRVYEIDRGTRPAAGRPRFPRAHLPQADAELHLVGEPQGRRGPQHLPGRLSRPRQHRRSSTARCRCRPAATLDQSDGTAWMAMYALDLMRIAIELALRGPDLRGHRRQVLRAFPAASPRRSPIMGSGCGTSRTSSSTTCSKLPDGSRIPLRVRSMVGLIPLFAVEVIDVGGRDEAAGLRATPALARQAPAGPRQPRLALEGEGERRVAAAVAAARQPAEEAPAAHARRDRVPVRLRRPLGLQVSRDRSPSCSNGRTHGSSCPIGPANRARSSSAAIRTGAARSGCRSTTC